MLIKGKNLYLLSLIFLFFLKLTRFNFVKFPQFIKGIKLFKFQNIANKKIKNQFIMTIFSKLRLEAGKTKKKESVGENSRVNKVFISEKEDYIAAVYSIIFSIGIILLIVFLIAKIYTPDIEKIIEFATQISVRDKSLFFPEPVERFQYLSGIFLFPLLLFMSFSFFRKVVVKYVKSIKIIYSFSVILSSSLLFFLTFFDLKSVNFYYVVNNYFYRQPINYIFVFLLFVLLLFLKNKYESKFKYINKALTFLIVSLIFLVVISVFLPRVFGLSQYLLPNNLEKAHDLETIFYSVSQVFSGKALLVNNFVNLYGLYPHFLVPIFTAIGLSIFNFTFIMTLLYGISIFIILLFLRRFVRDKFICLLGISFFFVFYIMPGGRFFPLTPINPYFQFFPLRIFFPFLLIFLSSFYFQSKNKILYYFSFVLYSVAILWNVETGIVVFLTWMLSLFYLEFLNHNNKNLKMVLKNIVLQLVRGLCILFFVFMIYGLYILNQYGSFPDFRLILEYQRFYYFLGLTMTPLKLIHPWNLVILIYLIGILYSLINLIKKENEYRSTVIFLLSVLGISAFSRFQGRGTDVDLWGPIYSAVILVIIFTDELWSGVKKNGIRIYHKIILFLLLYFFISSYSVYWFENFDRIYIGNIKAVNSIIGELSGKQKQSMISEDIKFIKNHTKKGEKIFILATFPSVYYEESKTISVLDTPGLMELFLKSDVKKIYNFLETNKSYKVFTGRRFHVGEYEIWSKKIEKILSDHYRKIDASKDDMIELYFPI
ncbi:MAG: hypothetical protein HY344_04795 [Candidatus Levybacteria bacterium]|nr:hypothetical protein [Candidatus Levybacteria bacterium]